MQYSGNLLRNCEQSARISYKITGVCTISEPALALTFAPYATPLTKPFRVASFTLTAADTVVLTLRWEDFVGYGESAPLARYGDSVASIVAFYESFVLPPAVGPFSRALAIGNVPRAAVALSTSRFMISRVE